MTQQTHWIFRGLLILSVFFSFESTQAQIVASDTPQPTRTLQVTPALKAFEYKLKNGLTVYLIPNKRAPLTSIYHWVQAGSLHEKPGVTGIAHLFEHMMFRPLNKGELGFFETIREYGGEGNANTRYTSTVYTTSVPHEHLDKVLETEARRFKNLKVDDDLLNIERKAVWSEYSTKIDNNPVMDLWHAIYHKGFPGHPFGWTIIGERDDLNKITAKDCNEFFQKYYVASNTGLFVAGDFDPAKTIAVIAKNYGDWNTGAPSQLPPEFKRDQGLIQAEGKLPSGVNNVLIGYRIPFHDGKNHHLLAITTHILFGSDLSLAERRFVHNKKIATSASDFNTDYDAGLMKGFFSLLPQVTTEELVKQLPDLLTDLEKLPNQEFQAYVREYQTALQEAVLRNESLNELAALSWGKWGRLDILAELTNKKLKLSKPDLLRFAKATVKPENLIVVSNKKTTNSKVEEKAP